MKKLLLITTFFLSLWHGGKVNGQPPVDSTSVALSEKARLNKSFDEELSILLKADSINPNAFEILWRLSRSYAERASRVVINSSQQAIPDRKEFFARSLEYAVKTKEVAPDSPNGYYYHAIAMGGIIQYGTYKEMINGSAIIKTNVEKAISLNDKHHRAMHVLGRWHFEVARLSSFVKFVANVFFNEIPKGSFEEAIINFRKAVEVKPLDIHRLWLAKSYLKLNRVNEAKEELALIISSPAVELNDSTHKSEARKMLEQLNQ